MGDGKNILRICNVIALLFSLTTLICLNGIHRKTWAAVLSTLCVLFLIMMLFDFSIHRYGDLDYSNLEYLGSMSNSADIFWTDIMLTRAWSDYGCNSHYKCSNWVEICSTKIQSVSIRKLIHSGREIGYDISGNHDKCTAYLFL